MVRGRTTNQSSKKPLVTEFLFKAEREKTYKKFVFDTEPDAMCTSKKLAEAGFYCTATKKSPSSAKCPFCLKELEFDAEDDPWEEHKKRGSQCEFVKMNKLDEKFWTVEDVLFLGGVLAIQTKSAELIAVADKIESNYSLKALQQSCGGVDSKPSTRTRRAKK